MKTENKKQVEIDPMISVTFGNFVFSGDFRLIPEVVGQMDKCLLPLMEKSTLSAVKAGLLPVVKAGNGEGYA